MRLSLIIALVVTAMLQTGVRMREEVGMERRESVDEAFQNFYN